MFRKGTAILLAIAVMTLTGCASKVDVKTDEPKTDEPVGKITQGVTAVLTNITEDHDSKYDYSMMDATVVIKNDSDIGIMSVHGKIFLYDAKGDVMFEYPFSFNGQDTPIAPGEERELSYLFRLPGQGGVKQASVIIIETKDEIELPPKHVPQQGEYLYQAVNNEYINNMGVNRPVKLTVIIDHGGDRSYAVYDSSPELDEMIIRFMKIKIGEESYTFVTDNYNSVVLEFADGTEASVSLNLTDLEVNIYGAMRLFKLTDMGEFWTKATQDAVYPQ
ncbi:MAG: hypothetical protein J5822_05370 [Eubacteriaceae bacterium]|nr:hypothetical protein [Eubacteriaceae bacterium]